MKQIDEACIRKTNESNIKFEEKKSKIIFQNPKRDTFYCIQVDGCAIKTGVKCDNMLTNDEGLEFYIELKGCDVDHAIIQLEETIKKLSEDYRSWPKKAFIISTRQPAIDVKIQNAKKRFQKNYNTELLVRNTPYNYPMG
ncbi:hypothetical protein [Phocaeicola sp.]